MPFPQARLTGPRSIARVLDRLPLCPQSSGALFHFFTFSFSIFKFMYPFNSACPALPFSLLNGSSFLH